MNRKRLGAIIYEAIFSRMHLYDLAMKISNREGLKNYRQEILQELGIEKNDCILEVNVGNGENLSILKELYKDVFEFSGIDLSQGMITSTEKRAEKKGWENVELVAGDAENLTSHYEMNYFDKIICINSANFYQNREKTLEMMISALKPGGKLLVSDVHIPKDCHGLPLCIGNLLSKAYSISGFKLRSPVQTPKNTKEIMSRASTSRCGLAPYYKIFQKKITQKFYK